MNHRLKKRHAKSAELKAVKIFVRVKLRARQERVEKIDETHFTVAVKELPIEGRANEAMIRALANYFGAAPTRFNIVSGHAHKEKIVEFL